MNKRDNNSEFNNVNEEVDIMHPVLRNIIIMGFVAFVFIVILNIKGHAINGSIDWAGSILTFFIIWIGLFLVYLAAIMLYYPFQIFLERNIKFKILMIVLFIGILLRVLVSIARSN